MVKLSGRPEAPIKRRWRILSSGASGVQPLAIHGPLQRLLGGSGSRCPNQRPQAQSCQHRCVYSVDHGAAIGKMPDNSSETQGNREPGYRSRKAHPGERPVVWPPYS